MSAWRLKAGTSHNRGGHDRDQVAQFLNPQQGYRGALLAAGVKPKDHMKENYLALKFQQAKKREEEKNSAIRAKNLYKLEQFRDVRSKVYDSTASINTSRTEDEADMETSADGESSGLNTSRSDAVFTQRGDGARRRAELASKARESRDILKAKMDDARWVNDRPSTPKKGATPKAQEHAHFAPRNSTNFISTNRSQADQLAPPDRKTEREKKHEKAAKHDNFGKVPDYIEQRKAKWAVEKEEMRKRMPDPNCPPGMKLMPDEERRETLEVLLQSRTEALKQLQHMPFIVEGPSATRKKLALEDKLKEIEDAVALFSRTKVFVKAEGY